MYNLWFNEKKVNLVFQASKALYLSYDEHRGELVLGIKIISDKSNSLGMSLQIFNNYSPQAREY